MDSDAFEKLSSAQRERNSEARRRLLVEFGALTAGELRLRGVVAVQLLLAVSNPDGGEQLYPASQFAHDGSLHVLQVYDRLRHERQLRTRHASTVRLT